MRQIHLAHTGFTVTPHLRSDLTIGCLYLRQTLLEGMVHLRSPQNIPEVLRLLPEAHVTAAVPHRPLPDTLHQHPPAIVTEMHRQKWLASISTNTDIKSVSFVTK